MESAKEIMARERKRGAAKKEYYKALLEQFCRKIRYSVELGHREAVLSVPAFLIGYPKYDMASTVVYMSRQLTRLGYKVTMVGPLDLKVEWRWGRPEQEADAEVVDPVTFLPSLVNLQKTAQKLRIMKKK
jgi:hypothetical protein